MKNSTITWEKEALIRLENVPEGMMRDTARQRIEEFAKEKGYSGITSSVIDEKYSQWEKGSESVAMALKWTPEAEKRIEKTPSFVRQMVKMEIERYAREKGKEQIDIFILEEVKRQWDEKGFSHS